MSSRFPTFARTSDLAQAARLPDIHFAVRKWESGFTHKKGDRWRFWMEGDPRSDSGITHIATYKCFKSGNDDAEWEKL